MEKTARKTSVDPVQERLRQNKANWNKEVSAFVNDLIHYKKLMNGWPSKFFKERSRITQPVPADPATIIGSLAGDFQEIVNKGNGVIQEQINYSKNRRQKQPKAPSPQPGAAPATPATPEAPAAPAAPDLGQQLGKGAMASDYASEFYLISEASNPLSRFFARLLAPGIGGSEAARIRKYRISLLNSTLQIFKDMKKMQASIVGGGPQSIFVASKLLDKVETSWTFLSTGFRAYQENMPGGAADTGARIDVPAALKGLTSPPSGAGVAGPKVTEVLAAIQDVNKFSNNFAGVPGMAELKDAAKAFVTATPGDQITLADSFLKYYRQVVSVLAAEKKAPGAKSFAEVAALSPKNASAQDQLEAVAQNFLGKMVHKMSPFDKTSSMRLDIYKVGNETRKLLNKIMNLLEDGLDITALTPLMSEVGTNIYKMRSIMHALNSTIKGLGNQPQFMNMLQSGRLGDHNVDLSPKQKADLEKMLERKQLRDITKKY